MLGAMFAVHRFVVRRRQGLDTGAWSPAPEPAAAIAEPLGRIANRHAPPGVGASGDLGDMIEAGTVAIGWHLGEMARDQAALAAMGGGLPRNTAEAEPEPAPAPPTAAEPPGPAASSAGAQVRGNAIVRPDDLVVSPAKSALAGAFYGGPQP